MRPTPLLAALVLLALFAPAASALGVALPALRADIAIDAETAGLRVDEGGVTTTLAGTEPIAALPPGALPLASVPIAALPIPDAPAYAPETPIAFAFPAPPAAPPISDAPPTVTAAAGASLLWLLLDRLGLGRALLGAFGALYFRVQPNELLEHERRERVIQLVRERPGIGPTDVAHALGTGWGVTTYHLDRLERAGLVTSQRVGQHRCYFVPGAVRREDQRAVGLVRGDTTRRVAQLVAERPGLTQSQLATQLGLSASAASKQVAKLVDAGLLRREATSVGQRLYAQPSAALAC